MEVPAPEGRRLDDRYRLELFRESEAVDEDAVIEMWTREGVLDEEHARERVRDVALVAVEREEGVVGVATTLLRNNPQLRMPLWTYRTFVSRAHRESDIAFLLLHTTRNHLRDRYVSGADTRGSGMVFEAQDEVLKRGRQGLAVWKTSLFAFIGESVEGSHHRVYYFPGALAPPPPGGAA